MDTTTTQAQKLWLMAFNKHLGECEGCSMSITYWDQLADNLRRTRGETDAELAQRRADCRTNSVRAVEARNKAEDAMVEWVKSHPYPAGGSNEKG